MRPVVKSNNKCNWSYVTIKDVLDAYYQREWIEGGGDSVSVHFAVAFMDCWRTSFCVTTITKAAYLM